MRALLLALGLVLPGSLVHGIDPADLLPPGQAFVLDARDLGDDRVLLEWDIADGYYMYRERYDFESSQPGVTLGIAAFPDGEHKDDPFFGPMEIYRGRIGIELPVAGVAGPVLELSVTSQGCADVGVCYPPETRQISVTMPAARADGDSTNGPVLAQLLSPAPPAGLFGGPDPGPLFGQQPELLPPDQAYIPTVEALAADILQARWTVAEGYYLYRAMIGASVEGPSDLQVVDLELPPGDVQTDEFFGEQQVYYEFAAANVRLAGTWPGSGEILLRLDYQGCAEVGVCYPPMSQTIPVRFVPEALAAPTANTGGNPAAPRSEQDRLAGLLGEQRFWSLPVFFGLGLLLAFTPCVFPMVPILSGVIMGSRGHMSGWHGFGLSLAFVLAMALTYTAAGVAAAAVGQSVQIWFQHPAVIGTFAALFGLLALAMFGMFQLQLPVTWQSRLAEFSQRRSGGKYAGVAAMGALSALIVGPCMAPPLIGILTLIATTGDHVLGGTALFAMSMGMGAPLLVLGASAGRWLPRAGAWMERIRVAFGIGLLAVAVWLLERIVPAPVIMLLWSALLISTAVYLGTLQPASGGWRVVARGFGVVMLVYGCLMLVGVAAGGRDTLQPLRGIGLLAGGAPSVDPVRFEPVKSVTDLQAVLATNRGTPVVLDFYADWCVSCKQMERDTFPDPAVQRAWAGAVRLKADVTANDAADRELLRTFGLFGPPAMLFFDPAGRERPEYRVVGFMDAARFARHLEAALAGS